MTICKSLQMTNITIRKKSLNKLPKQNYISPLNLEIKDRPVKGSTYHSETNNSAKGISFGVVIFILGSSEITSSTR